MTARPSDVKVPTVFRVHGTPFLSEGNTQTLLAKAPSLWAHVKVYAEGGENGVHAHLDEDHLFFVLAGEATFIGPSGEETAVGPYEGIMVPRRTFYAFRSSGDGNLVLLRVGSPGDTAAVEAAPEEAHTGQGIPAGASTRVALDGSPSGGLDPRNKTGAVPGVPLRGAVLMAPR